MKNLKTNQIIIMFIALMLVSVGYLSYKTTNNKETIIATSLTSNMVNEEQIAALGDAQLVSGNAVVETNSDLNNNNNNDNNNSKNDNNGNNKTDDENKSRDDYFSSSKLTRETMYSQMLESYEKILANSNIPADQKNIAQNEIKRINDMKNNIMICENLIKTKGFEDCVIFVNDTSITVIIKSEKLDKEQIAQIQNIITREMQADISNIHISNK